MKEESKKNLKILCKIMEVFAKIAKVFSIIAIPFIALTMVLSPVIINNIDIKDNKIVIKNSDKKVEILEEGKNEASLKVKVDGKVVAEEKEEKVINEFKKLVANTSKGKIITLIEGYLALAIALIVLGIITLNNTIKLFNRIGNNETPFVSENVSYLRKIAKFMIISFVVNIISIVILQIITEYEVDANMTTVSIFGILLVYIISYIFEYGIELQKTSKKKLFSKEKE